MKGKEDCILCVHSCSNSSPLWATEPELHVFSAHTLLPLLPPLLLCSSAHFIQHFFLVLSQTHPLCKRGSQWRNLVYRQNFILWPFCPNILYNKGFLHNGVIKSVVSRVRWSQFPSQLNHLLSMSSGKLLIVVCYPICEMVTVRVVVGGSIRLYIQSA